MRFSLADLHISALQEGHTAHCSGVKVPYLFYARRREMSAAIEWATLKTLTTVPPARLSDRERLLFRPRLSGGNKVNLSAALLLRTLAQTWAGMQRLQVRLSPRGAVLFHADSAATCQRGKKSGWSCGEKWWLCCYSCFNWKRKGTIPKPDDRALIKTTRKTSEVIKLWNPLRNLSRADVLVTGNICPVQTSLKAVVF